jgi:uncharacterized protein YjiS (DUF1127 family)
MRPLIDNFLTKVRERRLRRETFNELHRLSDRELNDMGISRGEIWHVAYCDHGYRAAR